MILLDSDHLSALQRRSAPAEMMTQMRESEDWRFAAPIIAIEEQLRGRLGYIRRHQGTERELSGYVRLNETVSFYSDMIIADYSTAQAMFRELRAQRIRIGTQDLKIASIALTNDMLLLTANRRDFERVPGLRFENWLA